MNEGLFLNECFKMVTMPSHFVCFQIPASSDHHVTVQIYVIFGHLIPQVANVGWLYQNMLAISIKKGRISSPAAPLSSPHLYRRVKIGGQNKLCRSFIQQQTLDLHSVLTCSEMLTLAGFCSPGWNWALVRVLVARDDMRPADWSHSAGRSWGATLGPSVSELGLNWG